MSKNILIKGNTVESIRKKKSEGKKISMLTAYDFSMAKIFDIAQIDIILVGDSAANVFAGHQTTLPITLNQMIYHASSVKRAVNNALVVADLPFGYYQSDSKKALNSAIKMMKESGVHAVKLEGGKEIKKSIKKIIDAGIPVMGHLGLTPQSINKLGSYSVQAKDNKEADELIENAKLLEDLGCFSVVLEKIPAELARKVTSEISIPTIGIGAGNHVDGQVLVSTDMLGLNDGFAPKFLRKYLDLHNQIINATKQYINDVQSGDFPNIKESY